MASTTNRLLVSEEDFFEYETISTTSDPSNIMPFIREAQKFDLVSVLPVELIEDIQDNMDTTLNSALLPYVRPVLCYYAFARYISMRSVSDTATGFVQKTNEYSTPASDKTITRIATEARNLASAYARELIAYLNDNSVDYPLWKNNCTSESVRIGSKISDISLK